MDDVIVSDCQTQREPLVVAVIVACLWLVGCASTGKHPASDQEPTSPPAPFKRVYTSDPEAPAMAVEKDTGVSAVGSCAQAVPSGEVTVDRSRRHLEQMSCTTALWIDGLFGSDDHVGKARKTYGRLEVAYYSSDFYGNKTRVRLDVRADFPNISKNLSGFFGREDNDAFLRDRGERFGLRAQFPTVDGDDAWLAGLGYSLPGSENVRSDFRVGVRGFAHPMLFVQNRIGYIPWSDDDQLLYLRATPFWNTDDGFGFTTGFDFSHVLSKSRLLRWSNVATITQESEGVDWRSSLIHYHALRKRRAIAYQTFIRGATEAEVPLREYGLQTVFRHPLLHQRLWGEWVLAYTWPKDERGQEREGSWGLGFGVELPFGERYD